jgi:hypothetical protein
MKLSEKFSKIYKQSLQEMMAKCDFCGKVFDSHEEGSIVNDGVLIDVPLCDKCYDKYTEYN